MYVDICSSTGPPVLTAIPSLDQWLPFRPTVAQIQEDQGVQPMPSGIGAMERQGISGWGKLIGFDPLTS